MKIEEKNIQVYGSGVGGWVGKKATDQNDHFISCAPLAKKAQIIQVTFDPGKVKAEAGKFFL